MKDDEDILIREFGFILFIVVMICFVTSCGVCSRCELKQNTRDSIYVERVDTMFYRDTIIQVQIRDSLVEAVKDRHELSHLETDVAISDAWVEGDSLYHTLRNKETLIPVVVSLPNSISIQKIYTTRNITREVEREMKWHEKTRMKLGEVFIFLVIAFVFYKVITTFVRRSF